MNHVHTNPRQSGPALFVKASDAITQQPRLPEDGIISRTAISKELQAPIWEDAATRVLGPEHPLGAITGFVPPRVRSSAIEKHIRSLLKGNQLPYAQALADRLIEMSKDLEDAQDEPLTLSAAAVTSLIVFLRENPKLSRPQLAAMPSGQIVARWQNADVAVSVNLFFASPYSAQYYVATPNRDNSSEQDWDSGTTSVRSLLSKLQRLDVLRWMER